MKTIIKEEWKDIVGYEGLYRVSNCGRVMSLQMYAAGKFIQREKILTPFSNGNGYYVVHLRKDNKTHVKYVHRLVAEAFLGNINNKDINHLDFNRSNNHIDNLEICSRKDNIRYSFSFGKYNNIKKYTAEEKVKKNEDKIYEMYNLGIPKTIIAKQLKMHYETLKKYGINLKNRTNKGYENPGKPIFCVETNEVFKSIAQASRKYNTNKIRYVIDDINKTAAGYHWKSYKNN